MAWAASARAGVSALVNTGAGTLGHMEANQGQGVGPYHQAKSLGPGHKDQVPRDQSLFSAHQGV